MSSRGPCKQVQGLIPIHTGKKKRKAVDAVNFCSACFQPEAVEPALLTAELQPLPPADASSSLSELPCLWTRATAWTGANPSHSMGCRSAESLPCIPTITQLLLEMPACRLAAASPPNSPRGFASRCASFKGWFSLA